MHENYIYVFFLYISENGQSNISIICLYKKNYLIFIYLYNICI